FIEWCAEIFQIRPEDHISSHAPLHFDLSVFDIYKTIEAGATVHMVPDDILIFHSSVAKFIDDNEFSVWASVSVALTQMEMRAKLIPERFPKLCMMLFSGEVSPVKHLQKRAELLPNIDLYNLYGPTETNVCTYFPVDRNRLPQMEALPIGRACANTEVFA